MKIAVAAQGEYVSPHFGHCEGFMVYETDKRDIKEKNLVENPGHQPGFLPVFLAEKGVKIIIAGGMGERAQTLFSENGIKVITGSDGSCDEAVKAYLDGKLESTNAVCKEHENAGNCGEH